MPATIEQLDRFIASYRNINPVLIKDVVWDFPNEQEGFLEQYEELAKDGINYQTPRFGSFGVMSDAFEHHTNHILEWAESHASHKGFESIADMLIDIGKLDLSAMQINKALCDKHAPYYYDVTTILMMELSYQVCLQFQQYAERVTA